MTPEGWLNRLFVVISLLGLLPVLPFLDLPLAALSLLCLLIGCFARQKKRYLSDLPATLLTVCGALFYVSSIAMADPVRPLVHALVVLLAVRQVTQPTPRHLLQSFVLSLILLAGSSLLTLSPWFFLLLILQISSISLALVFLTFYTRNPALHLSRDHGRALWRTAAWLPGGSLVLMMAFFFVLPRTPVPLWSAFNPTPHMQTGYSDEVRPGAAARVTENPEIAFRAEMEAIDPRQLYWRGTILNHFDGKVWRRPKGQAPLERVVGGRKITLRILQSAKKKPVLFTLDRPLKVRARRVQRVGGQIYLPSRYYRGKQIDFAVESRLAGRLVPTENHGGTSLDLPEKISTPIRRLATELGQGSLQQRVNRTQKWYQQQGLSYANEGLPIQGNPLEQFLFEGRPGNCEFFASSMALLLRLQGVPARLVAGYYGGEYNAFGDYYLVREGMAHVWVEALLPDQGWVRLDPSTMAVNADQQIAGRRGNTLTLKQRISDNLLYGWNRVVITYDLQQQTSRARQLGSQVKRHREWLVPGLMLFVGLAGLLAVKPWRWLRPATQKSRQSELFNALCQRLGLSPEDLPAGRPLSALAQTKSDPALNAFIQLYSAALYDQQGLTDERYHQLKQLVQQVRPHR